MITLRSLLVSVTIAATVALVAACGGSTGDSPAKAQSASPASASASSAQPTPTACASDPAGTKYASPEVITPRVDGVFMGYEERNYLVVLRYYPDHTAYLAIVLGNTPVNAAKTWVTPGHGDTGPFPHDASGAFTKHVAAGNIEYSVWKYTGDSLILHVVSHHDCREHSILMKFVVD